MSNDTTQPAGLPALSDEQIREVFLANGFTIKEGQTDLKPYVFAAARALLERAALAATGAQAQVELTLDRDDAIRIWHRHCDSFADVLGKAPPSVVVDAMLAFAQVAVASAQPELLAALENLRASAVRYLPNYNEHSAIQDADEVIVKFTGEQP